MGTYTVCQLAGGSETGARLKGIETGLPGGYAPGTYLVTAAP
ncbi:MAG: hypothetical protein QOD66_1023 [Solirubrobacteraceae bacterium]|jgi:hypothetical protein|nr:hypothetical protein [Solirubrobacteraceae bacterium]